MRTTEVRISRDGRVDEKLQIVGDHSFHTVLSMIRTNFGPHIVRVDDNEKKSRIRKYVAHHVTAKGRVIKTIENSKLDITVEQTGDAGSMEMYIPA